MSWFSFFRKDKVDPAPDRSDFYADVEDIPVKKRGRSKAKDEEIDPVLPEKKRARRRLVGAVAITLALVIVLPMLLDSEPKPVSEDIVIQIPTKDKLSKLSAVSPTASASAALSEEKPEETAKLDNQVKTLEKPTAAKPAEKDGNVKASSQAPQSKVVIQVAALTSADKVKELRARLTKAGFKSYTQKVATDDGERIRVRVGPYGNKKDAEKFCPKLIKMKLKCTVLSN
jgi:DedD protein